MTQQGHSIAGGDWLAAARHDPIRFGGGYRRIDDILKDRELLHELIASALADLARVRERYEMLAALSPVWRAMKGIAKRHKVTRKAA